jgi:hypothetical protein
LQSNIRKVNENKEQEIKEESVLIPSTEELNQNNNADLGMEELIAKINILAENTNPYTVSKEVEEIKSLFYIKLKAEIKNTTTLEEAEETTAIEENTEDTPKEEKILHPQEIEFKKSYGKYKKIKFEFRKKKEKEEEENLKIKKQIIEDIDSLTHEDESLKKTFEHFRILQEQWKNTGHVPQAENNDLWQSYHHHVELFYDYIKINNDLRDLDFTRNLEEKTEICNKAEALINEKSFNTAHNSLQELHEHWKNVGPVKRELREELWERFQKISRTLNKNRNDFFLEKKEQDKEKLTNKNAICKEIDKLTSEIITSHDKWQLATNHCNELEIKWKGIGRLNKSENTIAWKNLRETLNNFYHKKNAFYKKKKEDGNSILTVKISICEKAEALQESTDWQGTGNKLITLQGEWKNAGFSPADQSNKIWKRFKGACDTFFNARKAHYKLLDKEKEVCFKAKEVLLKEVKEFKSSSDSKSDIKQLKEFGNQWKTLGHVPRNKIKINEEFFSLINTKFEELGLSKKTLATEQYKNKVSSLKGNDSAKSKEQQFLRGKITTLKKDISQYENNMSFFGNNKGTEPLKKQVEQQIEKANTEIEMLKQKLQILNKG